MTAENSFDARAELEVGGRTYEIYRLGALQSKYDVARLPFSLKILLENLLRNEDGVSVREAGEGAARLARCGRQRLAEHRARHAALGGNGIPGRTRPPGDGRPRCVAGRCSTHGGGHRRGSRASG